MPTLMKRPYGWQSLVRIKGHPQMIKTFKKYDDAKRWGLETELKIRREEAGILKIKFPKFSEVALKYINEVSLTKRSFKDERYTINALMREPWSEYPINRITPNVVGSYRDKQLKTVSGSLVNCLDIFYWKGYSKMYDVW